MPKMNMGIVTRISLLVGVLVALIASIIVYLEHYGSTKIILAQAVERLKYETTIVSSKVLHEIEAVSADALFLIQTPPVSGIPRAIYNDGIDPFDQSKQAVWETRLSIILAQLLRIRPGYQQISFIGIRDQRKEIVRVERIGANIQRVRSIDLQSIDDPMFFKNVLQVAPGEVYLSEITLHRENGLITIPHRPMIQAATPVYFEGLRFGLLVIHVDLSIVFNKLVISIPDIFQLSLKNELGFTILGQHRNNSSTNVGFDHTVRDDNILQVEKAFFDPLNLERFLAVEFYTSNSALMAESNALRNKVLFLIGLLVLISFLIALMIVRRYLKPLDILISASEDIAAGRSVDKLPILYRDEIGHLIASFNIMSKQLVANKEELIASQNKMHQVNKMTALGEMASSLAHEINSPILEISMVAERVIRRAKKHIATDNIQAMQQIINSVSHIAAVILSLRKVSRKSSNDDFQLASLNDILADVQNLSQQRLRNKNITFKLVLDRTSHSIHFKCQRLQITQVLINLVNNSYDSICDLDKKWILIKVRTDSNKLLISVTDSGSGIPELIQQKIFEPMFTSKNIGEGTGLGLSISASIIEKHQGQLIYNPDAKNTQFILQLPLPEQTQVVDKDLRLLSNA